MKYATTSVQQNIVPSLSAVVLNLGAMRHFMNLKQVSLLDPCWQLNMPSGHQMKGGHGHWSNYHKPFLNTRILAAASSSHHSLVFPHKDSLDIDGRQVSCDAIIDLLMPSVTPDRLDKMKQVSSSLLPELQRSAASSSHPWWKNVS